VRSTITAMLRLLLFLLDLVLMSSILFLVSGNAPILFSFGLGILLTIRVPLSIMIHRQLDIQRPPAIAINALLQRTPAPEDGRCLICHTEDMFKPRKLSCDHVFCRDCALLVLCKQDTCPMCGKPPLRQLDIITMVSRETLFALLCDHAIDWLFTFLVLSLAWVIPCVWHWRGPTCSDLMLAAMRATIHLALCMEIDDIIPAITYFRSRRHHGSWLVNTSAAFCTSVVTLPYDYAAWMYSTLFAAWVTWQYWNYGF
jgi:hypothetical protein